MNVSKFIVLCLLAQKNPPKYAFELINKSGGILKYQYTYVLLNKMQSKGLVTTHSNLECQFYVITPKGKLKLLNFMQKLGLDRVWDLPFWRSNNAIKHDTRSVPAHVTQAGGTVT